MMLERLLGCVLVVALLCTHSNADTGPDTVVWIANLGPLNARSVPQTPAHVSVVKMPLDISKTEQLRPWLEKLVREHCGSNPGTKPNVTLVDAAAMRAVGPFGVDCTDLRIPTAMNEDQWNDALRNLPAGTSTLAKLAFVIARSVSAPRQGCRALSLSRFLGPGSTVPGNLHPLTIPVCDTDDDWFVGSELDYELSGMPTVFNTTLHDSVELLPIQDPVKAKLMRLALLAHGSPSPSRTLSMTLTGSDASVTCVFSAQAFTGTRPATTLAFIPVTLSATCNVVPATPTKTLQTIVSSASIPPDRSIEYTRWDVAAGTSAIGQISDALLVSGELLSGGKLRLTLVGLPGVPPKVLQKNAATAVVQPVQGVIQLVNVDSLAVRYENPTSPVPCVKAPEEIAVVWYEAPNNGECTIHLQAPSEGGASPAFWYSLAYVEDGTRLTVTTSRNVFPNERHTFRGRKRCSELIAERALTLRVRVMAEKTELPVCSAQ